MIHVNMIGLEIMFHVEIQCLNDSPLFGQTHLLYSTFCVAEVDSLLTIQP